jgi:DNA-binding ferritin-like protein
VFLFARVKRADPHRGTGATESTKHTRKSDLSNPGELRVPKGREEAPVQISRTLHAHEIVLKEARAMAKRSTEAGDDGTNDLIVSDVIRRNELQVWSSRSMS